MGRAGQASPSSGRQEGFVEQLCREHAAQLLQYLTRMMGQTEVAEEVAQDTYEQLQKMYQPQEVMFPRAMLYKVATNFALMRLRRARLERSIISAASAGMEEVPDELARPDRQAIKQEINQRLVQTIKELKPELRRVFVMAHVQGKARKDIAEELGITLKRVDKRMTRALKHCRERLKSHGIDLLCVD